MPQYRKLHVKVCESLDVNDMPDDFTRLLWVLLPLGLCREGRGLDNAAWVKAKIFPLREDVSCAQVGEALDWYARRGMIRRYEVDARAYFYVPTWERYQGNTSKEGASDYPPPPEPVQTNSGPTPEPVQTNSALDVDADANVDAEVDANVDAEQSAAPTPAEVLCLELYGSVFSESELNELRETEKEAGVSKVLPALQWAKARDIDSMRTICTTARGWIIHKGNGRGGSTGPPADTSPMAQAKALLQKERSNGNGTRHQQTDNGPVSGVSRF